MVECSVRDREVPGSNPGSPTTCLTGWRTAVQIRPPRPTHNMLDKLVTYGVISQSTSNQMALAGPSLLEPNRPIILLAIFIAAFLLIYGLSGRDLIKSLIAAFGAIFALSGYFIIVSLS